MKPTADTPHLLQDANALNEGLIARAAFRVQIANQFFERVCPSILVNLRMMMPSLGEIDALLENTKRLQKLSEGPVDPRQDGA